MAVATKNRIKELVDENGKSNGRAASKKVQQLRVIAPSRSKIAFTLKGISPLITHAWGKKAIGMMEDKQQKKGVKVREAKNPNDEMESCFYRDSDDDYCVPAGAIKGAIVSAALSLNDKQFSKNRIKQGLFVLGDLLKIDYHGAKPAMRTDMVRLKASGSADIRYRPEFKKWSIKIAIEYNENVFSSEQVAQLVELAGFAVGICEWRPERGGSFGRWTIMGGGE